MTTTEQHFIGYEYSTKTVANAYTSYYSDGYANLGWELTTTTPSKTTATTTLKFKRDRKIRNKVELTRLQREFDGVMNEIAHNEQRTTSRATIVALALGVLGCAFMAGSVFAVTSGLIVLCILLAIPGFALWIAPLVAYRKVRAQQEIALTPAIEAGYDQLFAISEKGSHLL